MYLSLHCCLISLLSIVPGTLAQSVTVGPATAILGEDATLTCTFTPAVGVTPATLAAVTWYKSDDAGNKKGITLITNLSGNSQPNGRYSLSSNGYLIISDVTKEDTNYYLCQVTTSTGDNSATGYASLTVHYLETPTLEPNNAHVNETDNIIFTCSLPDGVPTPITITWIKDGGVLDVSHTEKYPQSDTTLEINRVNKMDEGDYQCRAENAAYSGNEGKLSNKGTLSVVTPGGGSGGGGGGGGGGEPPIAPIIGGVIGCLVLVALIVGLSYKYDKLCFSRNAKKARGGGSEKVVLNSNFSDVDINNHAQVQKPKPVKATKSEHSEQAVTQTKPPDKPQRAPSRDRANVEQLTYADLDLVKSEGKIIHTDPETKCSSVRTEKQLTYADLDLTKDVNTGSKDKIIRTQPETEYSSIMITKK